MSKLADDEYRSLSDLLNSLPDSSSYTTCPLCHKMAAREGDEYHETLKIKRGTCHINCKIKYINWIYNVYTMYILNADLELVCVCIYMLYACYVYVICIVYTSNILSIFHVSYPLDIPSLVQMGLFLTFFYNDMPMIYQVHSLKRLGISLVYHYKKGTEQTNLY